jgi:hypothetical protein
MNHAMLVAIVVAVVSTFFGSLGIAVTNLVKRNDRRDRAMLRIERKLDTLLKNAGIEYSPYANTPYANTPTNILEAIQNGQKIEAIRLCREWNGTGLKEAKEYVEELARKSGVG